MNKVVHLVLVALLVPLVLPSSGAQSTLLVSDSGTFNDYTVEAGPGVAPGMDWYTSSDGNPGAARYVGVVAGGEQMGYNGGNDKSDFLTGSSVLDNYIYLVSPEYSPSDGKAVQEIRFDMQGGSETDFDFFVFDVLIKGSWTNILTFSGTTDNAVDGTFNGPAYVTQAFDRESLGIIDEPFQVRFGFGADGVCDSFSSDVPLCAIEDYASYWVDNLLISESDAPAPELPEPAEGQAGNQAPVWTSFGVSPDSVNITADDPGAITFEGVVYDDVEVFHADAYVINAESFEWFYVPLQRQSIAADGENETWAGSLSAKDVRLTTGEWQVAGVAYDAEGGVGLAGVSATGAVGEFAFDVEANDITGPSMRFMESNTALACSLVGEQHIHASSVLRFVPESNIVSKVTYQLEFSQGTVSPEFELASPYILSPDSLVAGDQGLTVRLYDRDHNTASCTLHVVKDTGAPAVEAVFPEHIYKGVPFDIDVFTRDQSQHAVTVTIGDQVFRSPPIQPPANSTQFEVTLNQTGQTGFTLDAADSLGQSTVRSGHLTVEPAFTDVALTGVRALDSFPLPGDAVRFAASVSQAESVTLMPVTVTFQSGSTSAQQELDLPLEGSEEVSFAGVFRPGPHAMEVRADAPTGVNETDPDNQNATVTFQVYLGKTVFGDAEYFIQASAQGMPVAAVATDGTSYPLQLDQNGTTIYRFDAEGQSLHWNPLERDDAGRPVTTIEPATSTGGSNGIPALGPIAALVLLGVAAAMLRRRL